MKLSAINELKQKGRICFLFFTIFGKHRDKDKPVGKVAGLFFPASPGTMIKLFTPTPFQMGSNAHWGEGESSFRWEVGKTN